MNYSSDDVQKILQLAMARKQQESFSGQQLLEMGRELGISPELLESAKQEWLIQSKIQQEQQTRRQIRLRKFKAHLISFVAVNTFLVVLNLVSTPRYFWAIYPISGWGLGLFMHYVAINRLNEKFQDI
ncbi:MAG: 2TM domain-containing protein [Richelia sp. RM2_1_2]|nr:2TM domain-containing protein [Richelia sp. SM2_1_7]NJM20595.1 2TM domain-containing protein [Richelia sp. SM1_7_0]NJN11152.1 2TM domain-containing protein [Richelia sp. RM1_1_1]NJO29664.1 2TM domain-containing protein [Richelia sp. SL_2_1]NJO57902.1 2TM domain-containing protein [Richelia sp. RM2_1_2]